MLSQTRLMDSTFKISNNNKNYTTMTTNNRILATLSTIANGTMGVVVTMATEPTWKSVKSPYKGRVIKHTRISNVGLGVCYKSVVESHAERSGVDDEYIAEAPKGMHYPTDDSGNITTRKYLISNSNPEQLYLNLVYRGNENVSKVYYLDGVLVEDIAVIADIESYIRVSSAPKKQLNYGVAFEDRVLVNRPKFENILTITQGGTKVYTRQEIVRLAM